MSKQEYPKARKIGLLVSKIADETVVYDTERDTTSCLNDLAVAVWEACDGESDAGSIVAVLKSAGFQDATDQIVLLAVDRLQQSGLLEESVDLDANNGKQLSRREMLQLLGARAAALLPVVTTVVVPPPIAAASLGEVCSSADPCSSGICCGRTGNSRQGICSTYCPPGHAIP
jgi:hypothetical protein